MPAPLKKTMRWNSSSLGGFIGIAFERYACARPVVGPRFVYPAPMKLSLLAVPAALVLGCGGKSSPSTPAELAAPAGASVVLQGEGDVDGKPGAERITLYSDGTLHAGAWAGKADAAHGDAVFMERQGTVRVELLAAGVRAVVLGLPAEEQEDPPTRWQVFVASDGALRRVLDITPGSYGEVGLRFPGDGTVRYTEDGWTACAASEGQPSGPIHEITLGPGDDGMLVEKAKTPTGKAQDCGQLAACPWIYVDTADGPVKVGEILRDLRGRTSYALQALALPAAPRGTLSLRVVEEEDEVTFLDEIYVEAGGERIYPTACSAAARPAYCEADHVPLRMQKGDVLRLAFELPAAAEPVVFARGYYIPTPSRR